MSESVTLAPGRRRAATPPWLGVALAIAITTTMDATGLSDFSALPLLPLTLLLWWRDRMSPRALGLTRGPARAYLLAVVYPVLVMAPLAALAAAAGAADLAQVEWGKAWTNVALVGGSTILAAMLTEEGFFRGWLWASLAGTGRTPAAVLAWSSAAFSLWHLSAVALDTGFDLPAPQIPVFLANAALLGAAWGLLRSLSGSLVVASVSHGVWNGLAYALFGFGDRVGAVGIADTAIYGAEAGVLGLALNAAVVLALLAWHRRRADASPVRP